MPKLRLSAEAIHALELPAPGEGGKTRQRLYYDEVQPGLAVRVTSGGSRVFVAEDTVGYKCVRVKLGPCSALTVSQARQRAREVCGEISKGINPNVRRRLDRERCSTFAEAFEDYVATRVAAKRLAPRTEYDYRRLLYGSLDAEGARKLDGYLSPWRALPLASITAQMVLRKHAELVKRSGAQANYAMRMLSAVWTFASAKRSAGAGTQLPENPVRVLSRLKAWVRIERRKTCIPAHQLADWFQAVRELSTEANNDLAAVARIYLQSLVLTGHRPGELARLRIEDVDLKARTFKVRRTKNGTDHTLPMSDYLHELWSAWLKDLKGEFVFPGAGPRGHIVEVKKLVAKVRIAAGVSFTLHDLRRTFITIAESLDISHYALKRLLNHRMSDDITASYIITDVERLRAPMQKVNDFILRVAALRPGAEVIRAEFRASSHGRPNNSNNQKAEAIQCTESIG